MKHLMNILAVILSAMVVTSCAQDYNAEVDAPEGKAVVTFAMALPNAAARNIGDGSTAKNLYYTVYDENWNELPGLAQSEDVVFTNLQTTLNLELAVGVTYNFTFWAAVDKDTPYKYEGKSVTVDYTGAEANDEKRDAFFAATTVTVARNMPSQTVTLYRPFAQVNFGTSDWDKAVAAGLTVEKTLVKTQAYTTLDLVTGDVDLNSLTDVTFAAADIPDEVLETTSSGDYTWLAMNYLLLPKEQLSLSSVTMEVYKSGSTTPVSSITETVVPVKRNNRTHIVGSLLIEQTVFNVKVDASWPGEFIHP